MRVLTVASSFSIVLSAAVASAAEPLIAGGGANKLSNEGRSAVAAADVTASEIDVDITHAAPEAGASGIKTFDAGNALTRSTGGATNSRLSGEPTRLTGALAPKGLSTATARRAATGSVPMSIVKRAITAAPKGATAVKRLTTTSGPTLQATGTKFASEGVKNIAR